MIGIYLEKTKASLSNTTKKITKKFRLICKYSNYPTWDKKQCNPDKLLSKVKIN